MSWPPSWRELDMMEIHRPADLRLHWLLPAVLFVAAVLLAFAASCGPARAPEGIAAVFPAYARAHIGPQAVFPLNG